MKVLLIGIGGNITEDVILSKAVSDHEIYSYDLMDFEDVEDFDRIKGLMNDLWFLIQNVDKIIMLKSVDKKHIKYVPLFSVLVSFIQIFGHDTIVNIS